MSSTLFICLTFVVALSVFSAVTASRNGFIALNSTYQTSAPASIVFVDENLNVVVLDALPESHNRALSSYSTVDPDNEVYYATFSKSTFGQNWNEYFLLTFNYNAPVGSKNRVSTVKLVNATGLLYYYPLYDRSQKLLRMVFINSSVYQVGIFQNNQFQVQQSFSRTYWDGMENFISLDAASQNLVFTTDSPFVFHLSTGEIDALSIPSKFLHSAWFWSNVTGSGARVIVLSMTDVSATKIGIWSFSPYDVQRTLKFISYVTPSDGKPWYNHNDYAWPLGASPAPGAGQNPMLTYVPFMGSGNGAPYSPYTFVVDVSKGTVVHQSSRNLMFAAPQQVLLNQ